jgi:predicted nucleotidyltransferase
MDLETHPVIETFKKKLTGPGIRCNKIVIYGSHSGGRPREDSDIDLPVASDDFGSMDLGERLCLLGRAPLGLTRPTEIIGLTEEENRSQERASFVFDEVRSHGIEV